MKTDPVGFRRSMLPGVPPEIGEGHVCLRDSRSDMIWFSRAAAGAGAKASFSIRHPLNLPHPSFLRAILALRQLSKTSNRLLSHPRQFYITSKSSPKPTEHYPLASTRLQSNSAPPLFVAL
jgi:hypothetical protein